MIQNKFGEMIFNADDIVDLEMQGKPYRANRMLVDASVDIEKAAVMLSAIPGFITYTALEEDDRAIEHFDRRLQQTWYMPTEYKQLDIAEHVLSLCTTQEELQRCGHELLMFQERDLFDLLRFLKYLVDTMRANNLIWGVGRGSSVASYVLYKLGVHRIDSMFYEFNIEEFLR